MHRETKETKKQAESREMGLPFFPMSFHDCISFILNQNAYRTLILDYL